MERFYMILSLLIMLGLKTAHAGEPSIVDVRRNITLADEDPVYKDFYINVSGNSGFKKNLVVTAVRKINVRDASGSNSFGEILIPVGQLKIIAIYDKIAVAREFNLLSRDELPMLEQTGIMTGDQIELKGSFIDNSKPKRKKVAELSPPTPVSPTTEMVAVAVASPVINTVAPLSPTGPAPASIAGAISAPQPVQKLEKTADSGNTSGNE